MKNDCSIDDCQTINTNSNDSIVSNANPMNNNNNNNNSNPNNMHETVKKENYSQQLSSISSSSPPVNCHSQSHSPSLINSIVSASSSTTTVPSISNININENYHLFSSSQSSSHQQLQQPHNNSNKNMSQEALHEYNNSVRNNFSSNNNNSSSPGLLQNISQNHYTSNHASLTHSSNKRLKQHDMTVDITNKEFSKWSKNPKKRKKINLNSFVLERKASAFHSSDEAKHNLLHQLNENNNNNNHIHHQQQQQQQQQDDLNEHQLQVLHHHQQQHQQQQQQQQIQHQQQQFHHHDSYTSQQYVPLHHIQITSKQQADLLKCSNSVVTETTSVNYPEYFDQQLVIYVFTRFPKKN